MKPSSDSRFFDPDAYRSRHATNSRGTPHRSPAGAIHSPRAWEDSPNLGALFNRGWVNEAWDPEQYYRCLIPERVSHLFDGLGVFNKHVACWVESGSLSIYGLSSDCFHLRARTFLAEERWHMVPSQPGTSPEPWEELDFIALR